MEMSKDLGYLKNLGYLENLINNNYAFRLLDEVMDLKALLKFGQFCAEKKFDYCHLKVMALHEGFHYRFLDIYYPFKLALGQQIASEHYAGTPLIAEHFVRWFVGWI